MKLLSLLLFLSVLHNNVKSSKILVITSMPAHSHYILAYRLAKELADREHHITFMSPYPQKTLVKNLKEVSLEDTIPWVNEFKKSLFNSSKGLFSNVQENCVLGGGTTEYALNNTNVQKLLNSGETFDVVILEHFLNEALLGIAHHFNCPAILLEPIPTSKKTNYLFANPSPSSYVPDLMGTFTKHMNFWQRLQNFISNNLDDVLREFMYLPVHRKLYNKYFKTDIKLDHLLHNISLMLTTSHPSVNNAIPHTPNVVEIGGYHISPPKQPPQDIQNYLDNATEGVVLFSMGSNLKSKDLTLNVRKAILNSFSKIKQKVLWKFEADLSEAPDNVKIMKWLPQQDIIGHPNIRAFITHGGLLSTIEAVYYGIPIIGIPVFGDQKSNIAAAVSNGYAIEVPLAELTEEKFSKALNEILNNPKYKENVQKRSKLMHDQPLKPIDLAIYWIEYVIRHKGAPHLRSAGLDLRWYQREMIDVIAFLITCVTAILTTVCLTIKTVICGRKSGYWKKLVDFKNVGTIGRTLNDFDRGLELTELVLKNSEVQKLLNSARHYDLVIVEHSFNEAAIGMGFHFNAPVVVLAPSGLNFRFYHLVGAPAPSSYVLDAFSVQTQLDTFWDRLNNFITSNFLEFLRTAMHLPKQNQIFQKYFKTKVDLDTIMYNVSLILSNSHSTVYDAVPYVPSVINIGGYHVKPPNGLPENLKNYLDNARNGVILFSMGSSMKSKDMDPKIHKLFFNVFSKLNENVIWKFERDLDNIPKNVKTFQWLPQQEVLAHPNVRAFITHGGLSSLIEAVYFGVPVVGLPSFSDQESNMAVAVTRGYGVRVDMKDITEDNLYKALQEILNEQKYKHNAIKMSKLMHDQPMKPIDSAIYWIEYVIRHRGAPYLRSPALDLAWYQREMVDILFFLMMVAAVLFITILIVIRKLLKLVCKGNVKKVMKSDKKKVWDEQHDLNNKGTIGRTLFDFSLGLDFTELMLNSKEVRNLLNSSRRYDLVIIEQYFNEAVIGMGHHFNAPVIILSPVRLGFRNNHLVGAPAPSSYVLDTHSVKTKLDTFWDRLNNFLTSNFLELLRTTIFLPKHKKLFKKYFNTEIDLDKVMYNVSLVLSNSHSTIHDAVPHSPAVKNIGGYHVVTPNKIPQNLKNFLDNSKNGVILFSMGSGMRTKDMNPRIHKLFINVFSKLKQDVIWKFESDLKNTPKNLETFKWLPQLAVLAHPNIRAFITHGGVSSLIEAVYFGVPVVGTPYFADQENNLATAVKRGYAVSVLMKDITEDYLYKALQEVLNQPKYKQNAIKMSKLMHDQPMKPIDSAIYWIEYVIRHRGAPYLRSSSLDLAWYQREMVDIFFFLTMATCVLFILIFIVIQKLFKLVYKQKLTAAIIDKKSKWL